MFFFLVIVLRIFSYLLFLLQTKYQDVKLLIKQECSINDFILDNLVIDTDGTKKVRIGLTDNTEGYKVMKCLDGYRMPGNFVLKAIPIGKAAVSTFLFLSKMLHFIMIFS